MAWLGIVDEILPTLSLALVTYSAYSQVGSFQPVHCTRYFRRFRNFLESRISSTSYSSSPSTSTGGAGGGCDRDEGVAARAREGIRGTQDEFSCRGAARVDTRICLPP